VSNAPFASCRAVECTYQRSSAKDVTTDLKRQYRCGVAVPTVGGGEGGGGEGGGGEGGGEGGGAELQLFETTFWPEHFV
jgi:hypothetical protein